jgi:hypothetical protein
MKQSNLAGILNSERLLLEEAPHKYTDFFTHSLYANKLMQSFVLSTSGNGWLFIAFLSQVRKHYMLAFLSAIRLHHVQMSMNLRQVLESGANAAYALANPNSEDFKSLTPEGLIEIPKGLQKKRYKWLETNYPHGSNAIKNMKDMMQLSSHSNIIDVHRNFKHGESDNFYKLSTPFFDIENEYQVKSDLWSVANVGMGLMDLFYGISTKHPIIKFSSQFVSNLMELDKENKRLKSVLMSTPNYKRGDKLAKERADRFKKEQADKS